MKSDILKIMLIGLICMEFSCKKFLEIGIPKDKFTTSTTFSSDELAISAISGIYIKMAGSFGNTGIAVLNGLSADEFKSYSTGLNEFYENQITPVNGTSNAIYASYYGYIYNVNSAIEGVANSNNLTTEVKNQVLGEAYFIRAFCHFYLVNIYGPVPIQLSTDYRVTRSAPRAAVADVYNQIITDLKEAEKLLTDKYYSTERVRPNLAAVQALLARVYLYRQDWINAEKYASLVIQKSNLYDIVSLDNVFLKNSMEAIWQLFPPAGNGNAMEGTFYILLNPPTNVALENDFVKNAFEINDKRRTSWIGTLTHTTGTYYFPFKYKIRATTPVSEYSMVLRLAEQYLIRAEARAEQNNLTNAIDDLDKIRNRAGLPLIKTNNPSIDKINLINAIYKERRVEFFSEWGHRWFDLKRTDQANTVLSQVKSQWKAADQLYPIPYEETSRNINIKQNEGY